MGSIPDWTSPPSGYCSVLLSTRLGPLNSKVLPNWPKMISCLLQCSCKTTTCLLLMFVSQLIREGLAHQSIKRYLSAVRNLHITAGLHEEFSKELTPKLETVLRSIKKQAAKNSPPHVRLPITIEVMAKIKEVLQKDPTNESTYCSGLRVL